MNTSNISNPTQFIHSPSFAFYIYAIFSLWQHCRSNYNISYNFAQFLSFLWCDCSWISNHLLHNFLYFFMFHEYFEFFRAFLIFFAIFPKESLLFVLQEALRNKFNDFSIFWHNFPAILQNFQFAACAK